MDAVYWIPMLDISKLLTVGVVLQ